MQRLFSVPAPEPSRSSHGRGRGRRPRPTSDFISGLPMPPTSPQLRRNSPIAESKESIMSRSSHSGLFSISAHKKRRALAGSSGTGSFVDPAELESRLRGSRAECEQLRLKVVSTQDESSRLHTQMMELHEVKEVCCRLETELSLLRSRTQSRTDEMHERLQQMDEENKSLRHHVGSLENQLLSSAGPQSLGNRVSALERENDLLCRESADVREEYRRFVEDIGNQVVQSVIVQKSLRDECVHMRNRLHNLERQNQYLAELLHARLSASPPAAPVLCQECPMTQQLQQHPLAPSTERTACLSERDAAPHPPIQPQTLSWSPPSLEPPEDSSDLLAFTAGALSAVTNGCYYKLEFSQSAISSPMGLPAPIADLSCLPSPPPPPPTPPPINRPSLGRSHVIMGSKTLPLRHSVPSANSHARRSAGPITAPIVCGVRRSSSSIGCPPTSRSFSKDDGYASMTCDLTSPIASRRELSTVGECPSQFEEDSTATASDATTATIVPANASANQVPAPSTVTSTIGGDVFELDADDGSVTPTDARLAPSLDLETCALLRHTAGAAKRLAELCHVTPSLGKAAGVEVNRRRRRPVSDSALLLLLSELFEGDDVIINSSGSSTGTGSSSSGSGHRVRSDLKSREEGGGGGGGKMEAPQGPMEELLRRLRSSVKRRHHRDAIVRASSDISLNLSAIDGLECRSSFGSSRASRALQYETGTHNSGKVPADASVHECLGMLVEQPAQALPLKSEQPPSSNSTSAATITASTSPRSSTSSTFSQPPSLRPGKSASVFATPPMSPPLSPPVSHPKRSQTVPAQVPPPVVIQRRRFGRCKSDSTGTTSSSSSAHPSSSSSSSSHRRPPSSSTSSHRQRAESLSSSDDSDAGSPCIAPAATAASGPPPRRQGAQRPLSRRPQATSTSNGAPGRRPGTSAAPPPPPRSSSSSSSLTTSSPSVNASSRSPRVNLVHQTSLDEVKKRQGPRNRQHSSSSPPTASNANSPSPNNNNNNNNNNNVASNRKSVKSASSRSTASGGAKTPSSSRRKAASSSSSSVTAQQQAKSCPPPPPPQQQQQSPQQQQQQQRRVIAEAEEEDLNPVVDLLSPSDFLMGGALAEASRFHQQFLRLCQKTTEEAEDRNIREKIGQLSATVSELQRHLLQLAPPAGTAAAPPGNRSLSRSSSVSCEGAVASDRDDLYIDDDLSAQPAITLGSENRDSLLLELEEYELPESSVQHD